MHFRQRQEDPYSLLLSYHGLAALLPRGHEPSVVDVVALILLLNQDWRCFVLLRTSVSHPHSPIGTCGRPSPSVEPD
jgi:hypothetical protein